MRVYVSGPYRAKSGRTAQENIQIAREISVDLWAKGHFVLCPHLNTANFEEEPVLQEMPDSEYIIRDLSMIAVMDAMVMVPEWGDSEGARIEHEFAQSIGMPIYYYPELPELHPTEVNCPEQCSEFRNVVGRMYRVHLDKNQDYSPANVLLTGEVGLVTRLWDKVARLLRLTGFKVHVEKPGEFVGGAAPKNEPIDDAYMDLSVYGIIGILLRQGKWGK